MPKVRIVEVGLRDGLQNEAQAVSVADRLELARRLGLAGVQNLEVGAFVSPKWVPQMQGSREVAEGIARMRVEGIFARSSRFTALVPNEVGMQGALKAGIEEVAIFASCTESFSRKNLNCSIAESFARFEPVIQMARTHSIRVRGYLSVCFGCPYEGAVSESAVVQYAKTMAKLGVYEISFGDTIGVATPKQVRTLAKRLLRILSLNKIAMHFHDTRGLALANIREALDLGIRTFDSSIGGLGGCPYAPGSLGNVATEDVVYMLDGMGYRTGLDLDQLIDINHWFSQVVGHELPARVAKVKRWPRELNDFYASSANPAPR